ncbi:NAD(P)H-dependent oxidoreductase [Cellulophaga sp. HaHaR_3_176]|uniref:NAD(P)H-dependent oxidoreductase n=1 Tax=Cellulophaga sp. HaHaR_3_176 TaxID=1942464 RepID=UPI001C1FA3FE|nr:NAD(P)H-dependent oxidoreductase [Cellulophaga sp. HaHaR_3_176]QWX85042.1 NAD(P)H-dependent oxidoreductase [Cellulophaga sp. HaHaR_3_176]
MEEGSVSKLQWRYAVKKFDSQKILSEAKLNILKEAFNLTATSYGLQPLKLLVIGNKELQESLVKSSYGQRQVADASHLLVICTETEINEQFITSYFKLVKKIRNTEDAILNPFKEFLISDFSAKNKEEIENWATKQAYLALGNLLTVCALEGIDSCPMEGFIPNAFDEVLDLKSKNLKSVLLLPVGYRADDDIFAGFAKVRKSLNNTIIDM